MSDVRQSQCLGRSLVAGEATGEILLLDEPLSFWGGLDLTTGSIVDRRHPQMGESVAGRVVAMPFGRGSSSASSALCEAVRFGTGPSAILMGEPDEIVALGSIVADEIYKVLVPVLVLPSESFGELFTGRRVQVEADGRVILL